jgi:uncharacterized protein
LRRRFLIPEHRYAAPLDEASDSLQAWGMRLRHIERIAEISAAAWDRLFADSCPFVRHAWLAALEEHGCVGADSGWRPCHLLAENPDGELIGAVPLYLKAHSWGEFVFDFHWAEASQRLGRPYYPKLVAAVPFTPVTGPRIGGSDAVVRAQLTQALARLPTEAGLSSLHLLFPDRNDATELTAAGLLLREDTQYHWFNRGYTDFDAFLSGLARDKRKKIRQQRRKVADAGLRFQRWTGDALAEADWSRVYDLYADTYHRRGQTPYLSREFWLDYGRRPDSPLRLVLAYDGARLVAAALFLKAGDTLYGRHWGCAGFFDGLHFETCYYQGIDWCIEDRLHRFDAGAQGAHKLARGFEPVATCSAHVLTDTRLREAVAAALRVERAAVGQQRRRLAAHRAYKADGDGKPDSPPLAGSA